MLTCISFATQTISINEMIVEIKMRKFFLISRTESGKKKVETKTIISTKYRKQKYIFALIKKRYVYKRIPVLMLYHFLSPLHTKNLHKSVFSCFDVNNFWCLTHAMQNVFTTSNLTSWEASLWAALLSLLTKLNPR